MGASLCKPEDLFGRNKFKGDVMVLTLMAGFTLRTPGIDYRVKVECIVKYSLF